VSEPRVHWQPISALPMIASMIDGLLDEVEKQHGNLQACRPKPHVLDNYTVRRVMDVYTAQAEDVGLYKGAIVASLPARSTFCEAHPFSRSVAKRWRHQGGLAQVEFIRIKQHNGLDGLLGDRTNVFFSHEDWRPGNPGRN
jgi:hypothetical protein